MTAKIVAVANQKGGVGKTANTLNLARAASAGLGLKVLVVDFDPQSNASKALSPDHQGFLEHSMSSVMSKSEGEPISEVIVPAARWASVDLAPAGSDNLADAGESLMMMKAGAQQRLSKALDEVRDRYDLILIDCPPALNQLSVNAFTAADSIVVVTWAAQFSLDGIARLLETVDVVVEYTNPELQIAGVIINFWRETNAMRHWRAELEENLDFPIFNPPIQQAAFIAEAIDAGLGLDEMKGAKTAVLHETYVHYMKTILEGIDK